MIREAVIDGVLTLKGKNYLPLYRTYVDQVYAPLKELEGQQLQQLRRMITFAGENVPYYRELFSKLKITPDDFASLKDLEVLPILTKREIIDNYDSFSPDKFKEKWFSGSTGGSTGQSLRYRISNSCMLRNAAILTRGFGYAGYKIGDKMAVLAGGSLLASKSSLYQQLNSWVFNKRSYSSYGLDEQRLNIILNELCEWNPAYLRGYASSLALLAEYIRETGRLKPIKGLKAAFSTAEMLSPAQRQIIEEYLGIRVYNQYGLNDSGITAFEDGLNPGLAVDTERAILEVVDSSGKQLVGERGLIVGTSLYNYAFPFIRYDTNDFGVLNSPPHGADSQRWYLTELSGRVTDSLTVNGKVIGSPVLTVLMGKMDILQYQIIQKLDGVIEVRIKPGRSYSKADESFIKDSFVNNLGSLRLSFIYGDKFIASKNKHKFVIQERSEKGGEG